MAEIMPAEVLNLSLPQNLVEPFSSLTGFWSLKLRADMAQAIAALPQRLQCGAGNRVYLDMPDLSVLAPRDRNDASLQIHVLPAKSKLFTAAHSCVQSKIKFRLVPWVSVTYLGSKPDFFFVVKEPHALRELSDFEKKLMLAMGLKDVRQLDKLLSAPISYWAAAHSEPPDEAYDLADRMYEEADRQWNARKRFNALSECRYLN
jgi:hypothetical protein